MPLGRWQEESGLKKKERKKEQEQVEEDCLSNINRSQWVSAIELLSV